MIYRTAWEILMKSLIEMLPIEVFIDQSQSLNPMESPTSASSRRCTCTPGRPSEDHALPPIPPGDPHQQGDWVGGTNGDSLTGGGQPAPEKKTFTEEEAIACSLRTPNTVRRAT